MTEEEEMAAIEALRDDDGFFSGLETDHGIELSDRLRDAIVKTLAFQCLEDHSRAREREAKPDEVQISKFISQLLECLSECRQAPHGSAAREAYLGFQLSQPNGWPLEEPTDIEKTLQRIANELGKPNSRGAPRKHRRVLFGYLAEIYERAGGMVGASYKPDVGKIDSPFLRFVRSLIEACPPPFRARNVSGLESAVRSEFQRCRRWNEEMEKKVSLLDWCNLFQRLMPERVKRFKRTQNVSEADVQLIFAIASDDGKAAAKNGVKPKTSRSEMDALSYLWALQGLAEGSVPGLGPPKQALQWAPRYITWLAVGLPHLVSR